MKLFREIAAFLIYYICMGLICAAYASACHDLIVAFHLSMGHHRNSEDIRKPSKPTFYSGCLE